MKLDIDGGKQICASGEVYVKSMEAIEVKSVYRVGGPKRVSSHEEFLSARRLQSEYVHQHGESVRNDKKCPRKPVKREMSSETEYKQRLVVVCC